MLNKIYQIQRYTKDASEFYESKYGPNALQLTDQTDSDKENEKENREYNE